MDLLRVQGDMLASPSANVTSQGVPSVPLRCPTKPQDLLLDWQLTCGEKILPIISQLLQEWPGCSSSLQSRAVLRAGQAIGLSGRRQCRSPWGRGQYRVKGKGSSAPQRHCYVLAAGPGSDLALIRPSPDAELQRRRRASVGDVGLCISQLQTQHEPSPIWMILRTDQARSRTSAGTNIQLTPPLSTTTIPA